MKPGFLRSSRYSPGNMDRESLEALFVGRHDDMEDVLSRVTTSIGGLEKHYILLVGPRGSGKTHFLALVHHRLMGRFRAAKVLDSVAVAYLNEEEWGVASLLDFVVRILRALADQTKGIDTEIAEIFDRFSKDAADAESFAIARLRQHTRGKTLLLLCENLVDLFDGLGEEGQKRWRATIQEDGNWTIVASTPSLFAAVTLQDNPFYGFFTIRAFKTIDVESGLELLARKAAHENKMELAEFLRTPLGRARARAIHHLVAGNHRAYVVLFDFLDKETLDDLVSPFMHMVDDLTPYYQDRMRQLPRAQRKIVEFLCLEGRPATVKEVSTSCLMSHQTAAKQIGELDTAGFVSRTREGRNTFCELSEPLMRICIEVKDNKTQHFRLFVEFLRHWFTTREPERRHAACQRAGLIADLDRVHIAEAIRCTLADQREPLIDALCDEAEQCWNVEDYSGLAAIQETQVQDTARADDYWIWMHALRMTGNGNSAIAVGQEAAAKHPDDVDLQCQLAHAYCDEDRFIEGISAIDRAVELDGKETVYRCMRADILLRLKRFEEAIECAQTVLVTEPDHWHSLEQIIRALVCLDRFPDAETRARELVQLAPTEPRALVIASEVHRSRKQLVLALDLVEEALNIDADNQEARRLRGLVLFDMGDYLRASEDLQQSSFQFPRCVSTHCQLTSALLLSGNFEAAIKVAQRLIEMDAEHFHSYYAVGRALIGLGRHTDAITAFDKLLSTDDCFSLLYAAEQLRSVGEDAAAERYLDRAAELQPDNRELWIERSLLHIHQGAFCVAAESAVRLETLPGGMLLGRLLGAQAAAATKPLGVALERLRAVDLEGFESDEERHVEAIAGVLTISVRNFGPRDLFQGLATIRVLFADRLDHGVVGRILTNFLKQQMDGALAGSLADWEMTLEGLASSLADLPDCHIPVDMLQAAVKYSKTGNKRHLLSLPLEHRQLLEGIMPPASGERTHRA